MRASRLVSMLLLLQARGRLTAGQLARELEVSERTVYRDIQALHAAGVPLYGDAGPGGGYRLLDGYRTRLTGLTAGEAEALFLTGMPGPAAELGLGTVVATAQLKLQAALPAELRERAARIAARFHLDAPGWYHDGIAAPYLTAVAASVWEQRRVRIRYRRWQQPEQVTRTIDPYGLVLKAGTWYLVARAGSGGQLRTYRVSQILALTPLDESFSRPDSFDLAGYWSRYLADFHARRYKREAVIALSRYGRRRLRELMSAAVISAADATASAPDDRGWVRAVVPIESLEHATSEFLRLGADVEVLQPDDLRARISAAASALAAAYGAGASPPAASRPAGPGPRGLPTARSPRQWRSQDPRGPGDAPRSRVRAGNR